MDQQNLQLIHIARQFHIIKNYSRIIINKRFYFNDYYSRSILKKITPARLKKIITNIINKNLIKKQIKHKIYNSINKNNKVSFVEETISIKPIDYYYTNAIARSSKVMSECRQISKKFLFTGIEKAS